MTRSTSTFIMRLTAGSLLTVGLLPAGGCGRNAGATPSPGVTPTADTHDPTPSDTSPAAVDTSLPPTTDTATGTGDTAGLPCDPDWSADCHIVDGVCRDPLYGPPAWTSPLTDPVILQKVDLWKDDRCGPLVMTECTGGGAIVHAAWASFAETPVVEVYDAVTREWVAGFVITDDPWDICGGTVFVGDETWFDCASEEKDWVSYMYGSCGYADWDSGTGSCGAPNTCMRQEVL